MPPRVLPSEDCSPLDRSLWTFLEQIDPSASFLELGVGEGRLTVIAARRFGRVVGIDRDPRSLITTRPKLPGPAVSLLVMDAHRLEFPDQLFDATGEFNSLGGFADPGRVVSEMLRVTRPGGALLFLASWRSEVLILKAGWIQAHLATAGADWRLTANGRVAGLVARCPTIPSPR
ncbi:MAG TPA: class I SAM-dependent methyltransferase [Bacillota bacterium]|jgi:ubiquinone/menaquinone biosynthesis C-methylase UbiE